MQNISVTRNVLKWSLLTRNWIKSYKSFEAVLQSQKLCILHIQNPCQKTILKWLPGHSVTKKKICIVFIVVPSVLTIILPSYMHCVLGKWRKWVCCFKCIACISWIMFFQSTFVILHLIRMCVSRETNPWAFSCLHHAVPATATLIHLHIFMWLPETFSYLCRVG